MNANMTAANRSGELLWREGSVRWLSAIDEAEAIGRDLLSGGKRSAWSKRLDKLAARVERLNCWADDIDVVVRLQPIRGGAMFVPLCEAPAALRSLLSAVPD